MSPLITAAALAQVLTAQTGIFDKRNRVKQKQKSFFIIRLPTLNFIRRGGVILRQYYSLFSFLSFEKSSFAFSSTSGAIEIAFSAVDISL